MEAIWWLVAFFVLSAAFDRRKKKSPSEDGLPPVATSAGPSMDELRRQIRERMAERAGQPVAPAATPAGNVPQGAPVLAEEKAAPADEVLYDEETTPENEGSYAGGVNIPAALLAAEGRLKASQDALASAEKQISNATSRAYQGAAVVVAPAATSLAGLFASSGGLRVAFVAGEVLGVPKALR